MTSARINTFLSIAAISLIACERTPSGGAPPPARAPEIVSSLLTAGGEGLLSGKNLDLLPAVITVDGRSVDVAARTASEVRFAMPPGRGCEVDGRAVRIVAGSLSHTGRLAVPSTLRLAPAESRVLAAEELASLCLQLPAGGESYVLTALNPVMGEEGGGRALLSVRTWTGAEAGASSMVPPRPERAPVSSRAGLHVRPARPMRSAAAALAYTSSPRLFDPRYATAQEGDTVTWVDFRSAAWYSRDRCSDPAETIPTFGVVVAAVAASGRTVIGYDERTTQSERWESAEVRQRLARLVEMLDRWTVPAAREAYDPAYEPLAGAEGRWWHIFRTGVTQHGVDDAGWPRSMCGHYSEVSATVSPDAPPATDQAVSTLAGYVIHEYGHHAADVIAIRRTGALPATLGGWSGLGEAWAQTLVETAARLASDQPTGARFERASRAEVPYPDFFSSGYGERPEVSPWGGWTRGPYEQGTRLLMTLREAWGDAAVGSTAERFYVRTMGISGGGFPALAELAGMEASSALDRWSLAEASTGLADSAAATARALPQIRTWAPEKASPLPSVRLSRAMAQQRTLRVGNGNYGALYVLEAGGGVSITFHEVNPPLRVRITRLR